MSKQYISPALVICIIGFTIIHFITYFFHVELLLTLLIFFGFGIILFGAIYYGPLHLKMPLGLFLTGVIIFLSVDTSFLAGMREGLLQMRNMVGLLVVIPMVSWVLREEAFLESAISYAHDFVDTSKKFYFGMVSFTQIIAYFLLFGAIPMIYQFVSMILKDEKGEAWERYKGTAILRGFALSVLWVVSIPSFAYVVEAMGASLWKSIVQGLGVAVLGTIVAILFFPLENRKYQVNFTRGLQHEIDEIMRHTKNKRETKRIVREFILLFVSLFGSIFILSAWINMELLVLIPLVILMWILCYYIVKRRLYKLTQIASLYIKEEMASKSYQLCVMIGAGMLIAGLTKTGFAGWVVNSLYALEAVAPFINLLYLLPFMVIILGFAGLGPLTVMVLVAGILQSIQLPYAPELIVLAVTLGSSLSILLSPVIMPLIVLSDSNGLSSFKNGFQFNGVFAVVLYVLVMTYIQVMAYITG
ncbi:hypothetical protein [Oceanobacillus jeddahense]|uniref:Permease n=1 Tax=Oceanobacillus jeddahense TaxID=1462527 RepID=A0ABY5JUK1_9BACI|nr:hypothetical protein [Oceanobacillus jeddahense]UUI02244.1 hypothetical protein NP439_19710 [Oceanobacillus jeddahense]